MICPDCGEPMSQHVGVHVRIDIYQVMARIVVGADASGARDANELAERLRQGDKDGFSYPDDQEHHDRLRNAAVCVIQYLEQAILAQTQPMHEQVAGNA